MEALLFLVLGLGTVAVVYLFNQRSAVASIPPSDTSIGSSPQYAGLPLTGTFLPDQEVYRISQIAASVGTDARLLAAIRKAENGGPGREFGIVSTPAPTYEAQATIAAQTINANASRYEQTTGLSSTSGGRFTYDFIVFLGARYAPVGAANDPGNLNQWWVGNVWAYYQAIDYGTA